MKLNYVDLFLDLFSLLSIMQGSPGCIISISLRMVNTKSGAKLVGGRTRAGVAIGLFYRNKLETKNGNKTARKKLFKEKIESQPVISRGEEVLAHRKKIIFTKNPPSEAVIEDKFASSFCNGKSASADASKLCNNWKLEVNECPANGQTIASKTSENIYSKVYARNFSRSRRKFVEFDLNYGSYKISKVRINLVKHKLSKAQLLSLKLKKIPKNECIKNRRQKTISRKKTGIPVHLIPHGSSIIIDQVVPGKVTRIPHSLRYVKPSRTADNYGLGNKQDIEFDEADCPRKAVPRWAQGDVLDHALAEQEETDTDCIFSVCDPPNLDLMFPQAAARRDIWRTPPSSYSSRFGQRVEEVQGVVGEDLVRYVTGRLENKNC